MGLLPEIKMDWIGGNEYASPMDKDVVFHSVSGATVYTEHSPHGKND